jgi:hypothetical protein
LRLAPFICHEEGNTARRVSLLFRLTICMNLPNLFDIFCLMYHLLHVFLCLFNKLMPFKRYVYYLIQYIQAAFRYFPLIANITTENPGVCRKLAKYGKKGLTPGKSKCFPVIAAKSMRQNSV